MTESHEEGRNQSHEEEYKLLGMRVGARYWSKLINTRPTVQ